jgi:hypothetical protein
MDAILQSILKFIKMRKETRLTFRLSDIEKSSLKSKAHRNEMTMSQYMRFKTLENNE